MQYVKNVEGPVGTVYSSRSSSWIAYSEGFFNPSIVIYDLAQAVQIASYPCSLQTKILLLIITCVSFHRLSQLTGTLRIVNVWYVNISTGPHANCSDYQQIAISPDHVHLAAVSDIPQRLLTIWNIQTGEIVVQSLDELVDVVCLTFNPNNPNELVAFLPGSIRVYTIEFCHSLAALNCKYEDRVIKTPSLHKYSLISRTQYFKRYWTFQFIIHDHFAGLYPLLQRSLTDRPWCDVEVSPIASAWLSM
jgi:WD40 repeat protein